MLTDGLRLLEGTRIRNATIDSGTSFPSSPSIGELFFRTDEDNLYIHDGTTWNLAATAGGGLTSITVTGDVTGTLDGGTDVLTLATVAGSPGTVGSASEATVVTFNAKGLTTAVSTTPIQIAETQITDGSILSRNAGNETITGTWSFSNPVAVAAPTTNGHAANKLYVDQLVAGLSWRNSVAVATTANITLSDEQTIDGEFVTFGARVLVKNQTTASQNGIYVVGIPWTRADDFNETSPINEVNLAAVFVQNGTTNGSTSWTQTATVTTVGTDPMVFTQFLGAVPQTAGGVEGSIQFRQGGAPNGSSKLVFDNTAEPRITIGDGLANSYFTTAPADVSSSAAPWLYIEGSAGTATEAAGGRVYLIGGGATGQQDGGDVIITGGASGPSVNGDGGRVEIAGGVGTTRNGDVDIKTGLTSRLRIAAEGAFFVNGTAGTTGQVLQSNGVGAPPTWVTNSSNALIGTGTVTATATTTGAYAGVNSALGNFAMLALTHSGSAANERVISIQNAAGQFQIRFANDAQSSFTPFFSAVRSANTATSITLTGTTINLTGSVALGANSLTTSGGISAGTLSGGGAALTSLNATNLSSGTVNVLRLGASGTRNSTTFLRGDNTWAVPAGGGTGTVTTVSVASANGFAGSVANATTTPAITLSTSITGMLRGDGTALTAATAGTHFSAGTASLATGILRSTTGTGALSIAAAGDFPTLNQDTTGNAATATTAGTVTAAAQPNITSVGTLTSLSVSGTASAGNFSGPGTGLTGTATSLNIGGNAATATTAATVTSPSQPNITSVGTLSSLSVSGAVSAGSFSGAGTDLTGTAAALSIGGNAATATTATTATSATTAGTVTTAAQPAITSVGTLTSLAVTGNVTAAEPTTASHLTTKLYVDSLVQGLSWKAAARAATTANITLSGTQTIDGVAVVASDRVLVKNQSTASQNGIYVVAAGAWARSNDMDGNPSVGEVNGAAVYVTDGTTQADTTWSQTATVVTMGTDPLTFVQLSGAGSTNASSLLGSTLAANVVNSSLTSVGTLSSLAVSGAVTQAHTLTTTSAPAAGNTGTLDSFPTATYRSASYMVQIVQGGTFEVLNLMVVHDGTNAFVTEYGRTSTGTFTGVGFDASISSGTLSVTWTGGSGSPVIKSQETYITV